MRWSVGNILIWHRIGEVPILDESVIIAISSTHRKEAIEVLFGGSTLFILLLDRPTIH